MPLIFGNPRIGFGNWGSEVRGFRFLELQGTRVLRVLELRDAALVIIEGI